MRIYNKKSSAKVSFAFFCFIFNDFSSPLVPVLVCCAFMFIDVPLYLCCNLLKYNLLCMYIGDFLRWIEILFLEKILINHENFRCSLIFFLIFTNC